MAIINNNTRICYADSHVQHVVLRSICGHVGLVDAVALPPTLVCPCVATLSGPCVATLCSPSERAACNFLIIFIH